MTPAMPSDFPIELRPVSALKIRPGLNQRVHSVLLKSLYFIILLFISLGFSGDLFAIHAIFKGEIPIPRTHGPVHLNMAIDPFLKSKTGTEVPTAIGQFFDEHRFELNPALFPAKVVQVLADFYKGRLFRIEINYKPLSRKSLEIETLITRNTKDFGPPRVNVLPGTRLIFWDDGATRMILQIDEADDLLEHSLTYIDNDLFHAASRDRVQRETGGRSSYGK